MRTAEALNDRLEPISGAATQFIERLSLFAEGEGLPRIAGRIMGLLIVRQEPVAFDEIASALQISRASVSMNTRLLESRGVIRRVCRLGERRDLFEVVADVPSRLLEGTLRRQRELRDLAAQSLPLLAGSEERARTAIQELARFQNLAIEATERMMSEWRESR